MRLILAIICFAVLCGSSGVFAIPDSEGPWMLDSCRRTIQVLAKELICYGMGTNYPSESQWNEIMGNDTFLQADEFQTDPWGHEYVYRYPAVYNTNDPDVTGRSFDLYSLGRDGISRTGGNDVDDIRNWDLNNTAMFSAYGVRKYSRRVVVRWFLIAGVSFSVAGLFLVMRKRGLLVGLIRHKK